MSELKRRMIGAVLGVAVGIAIACAPPQEPLTVKSLWALGIFMAAVVWWIFDVVSDYGTAIFMCGAWAVFKVVPFATAFSSFATSSLWIVIGALGLGACANKVGLVKRVALMAMNKFPLNFKGQSLSLLVMGLIMSPFIPSSTAKLSIVAPFTRAIAENMGYEKQSKGAVGLFNTMFLSLYLSHPIFLSASFLCYALVGVLPKEVQGDLTWMNWFINALPWSIVMTAGCYFAILKMYSPDEKNMKKIDSSYINEQLKALGPMTQIEKIVAFILLICLCFWMTERMHGIEAALVANIGFAAMMAFGALDRNGFRGAIAWDAVVFIAALFNVPIVFRVLKIDAWIGQFFGPILSPLVAGNIFIFIIVLTLVMYAIRSVIASTFVMVVMFALVFAPLAIQAGIHPWIPAFVAIIASNVFYMFYHNSTFLVTFYASGGDMVKHSQTIKFCVAYMVFSLLGILACVPIWKLTGFIK